LTGVRLVKLNSIREKRLRDTSMREALKREIRYKLRDSGHQMEPDRCPVMAPNAAESI
jgi:hypothetical protein